MNICVQPGPLEQWEQDFGFVRGVTETGMLLVVFRR